MKKRPFAGDSEGHVYPPLAAPEATRVLSWPLAGVREAAAARGLPVDGILLVVDVSRQRLALLRRGQVEREYPISTSSKGVGNVRDTYMTPTGFHVVVEWIGDGEPMGRVFKARKPVDEVVPEPEWANSSAPERITTRILRLDGLEPGVNRGGDVDTFSRFVYLHGTNHEDKLGQPASRGCVRVGNRDMIDLFDRTRGSITWCWIGG
ncbi:MAG: L,D-transpeptidase [bacterium]